MSTEAKPRLTLVFEGWQFPILPSRAVNNYYIILNVNWIHRLHLITKIYTQTSNFFQCKHLSGFGFRRGGYRCKCRSGRRYPNEIEQPYWGFNIEQSTLTEYQTGFTCPAIERKWRTPQGMDFTHFVKTGKLEPFLWKPFHIFFKLIYFWLFLMIL